MSFRQEHRRMDPNASESIAGSRCCGCRCLSVITRGRKRPVEFYWCDRLREKVDPFRGGPCDMPGRI